MSSLLNRFPYTITPTTGGWVFNVTDGLDSKIVMDNCSVPQTYGPFGIATWNDIAMNLYLCDWKVTFSNPFYVGIPTHQELVEFLYGPTRIPLC
jgi:hypothetical protein